MYEYIKNQFEKVFGKKAGYVFSAPGRTEISGNHTDHQHGKVLAAAVNLEMLAAVEKNGSSIIRVMSEGYDLCTINTDETEPVEAEKNTTASLIRGIASIFKQNGVGISGFDAYVTSTVLPGSGLSSSAAFEVLIGAILNHLYNDAAYSAVRIAQIGQQAENEFFGKPCGLMDQTASSVGNIITIDFNNPKEPVVEKIDFDFSSAGYALCIIDSHASHADLTDEYAAIPGELGKVCAVFGKRYLREVDEKEFYSRIPEVREAAGDRGLLRAIHVFEENRRVEKQVEALKAGDFDTFLRYVTESGLSSWRFLQNVAPTGSTEKQEVSVALALAEKLLKGKGACRVHGGGFAGTIQAFVPNGMLEDFCAEINSALGDGSCHVLSVRPEGGIRLE